MSKEAIYLNNSFMKLEPGSKHGHLLNGPEIRSVRGVWKIFATREPTFLSGRALVRRLFDNVSRINSPAPWSRARPAARSLKREHLHKFCINIKDVYLLGDKLIIRRARTRRGLVAFTLRESESKENMGVFKRLRVSGEFS